MRKLFALSFVVAVTGGGVATSTAQAKMKFLYHKKGLTLKERVAYFGNSTRHEAMAIMWLSKVRHNMLTKRRLSASEHTSVVVVNQELRWHKEAFRWHSNLLRLWQEKWNTKYRFSMSVEEAICYVFGPYCGQAKSVSWCESGYDVGATNGQYLGIFQMGSSERATYGHGSTPYNQARAAYAYFVDSGKDWSPWTCKP